MKHTRNLSVALASALIAVLSVGTALAQTTSQPEVTVRGLGTVRRQIIGHDQYMMPIEEVQVSRTVSYRDLNLSTVSGRDELKKRIDVTAADVCRQLYLLQPATAWTSDSRSCEHDAIQGAMKQLPTAVASAENSDQSRHQ